jgi:hypothetical protein
MFYVVQKIHIATGHGGLDKMIKEANKKYANVSIEALKLFKELCEECQLKKRKFASKGLVVKPIVSKEFNSRGQMDLIHMQSLSYNEYSVHHGLPRSNDKICCSAAIEIKKSD